MAYLVRAATGQTVIERLEIADNFWSRFVGLQFRCELPVGCGLLIQPCSSVHTCFLRFSIDVVFLDGDGKVLATKRAVRPWRLAFGPRGSKIVLEMHAGTADFAIGETLRWS